jgi:superfamily I DNA and/or RNA helicase
MNVNDRLDDLKNALFDFSKRNPLVQIKPSAIWWLTDDKRADRVYKKAQFFLREYGLETTLDVRLFLKWSPPKANAGEANDFIISPLYFYPTSIRKIRRQGVSFSVDSTTEPGRVNPIIQYYFQKWYGLEIPESITEEDLIEFIKSAFPASDQHAAIAKVEDFNEDPTWQVIQKRGIGNFNYKKSVLQADYDQIDPSKSNALSQLLGEKNPEKASQPKWVEIDQLDQSQRKVIEQAFQENTVIQGPPGTGKSHTIVNLIGAYLAAGKKVLFVSEKRVALQVVQKRLAQLGFGHMTAFFNTQKDQKKSFYKRLNYSWQKCDERNRVETGHQPFDNTVQPLLDLYEKEIFVYREHLSGSYHNLIERLANANQSIDALKLNGAIPTMQNWNEHLDFLESIERHLTPTFGVENLSRCAFMALNPSVFQDKDPMVNLEKRLDSLKLTLSALGQLCEEFGLEKDLEGLIRLALTGSVLNMVNQVQLDLLNKEAKKYRSFNHWAKKYATIKTQLEHAIKANEGWTKKPSLSEITELLDIIRRAERHQESRNVFRHLKRNPSRLKSAFRDFHSTISNHARRKLLESLQLEWRLRAELDTVIVKLQHHFNISNPETEIDLIFNLRNRLDRVSSHDYITILEHEQSSRLIEELAVIHPALSKASGQLRFIFSELPELKLKGWNQFISGLQNDLPVLHHWLPEIRRFFELPSDVRSLVKTNDQSINELTTGVTYHNLQNGLRFQPAFKSLSGWELSAVIRSSITQRQQQQLAVRHRIVEQWKNRHEQLEKLSLTPAIGLKKADKIEKKAYKQARRRILHECHKKQRHLPVREFYQETAPFLSELQPVWMMNPLTVAEYLPCQPDLFDVVIFDESSQIPLEDAIPSVYRAKQVVVVGDSKQMPPGTFFSSRSDGVSLLNQAEQSFSSSMLKWHYRSMHPALINFSNQTFYDNQLICFPPAMKSKPIEFHQVKNGRFNKGRNLVEAAALVEHVKGYLKGHKSIAIITFSLEQEKCIRHALKRNQIEERNLDVRNLENVQGTQADIVFLSIGYGLNDEGVFRQHFGPINQENGANRLNVMFSRAREKMIVFSSVTSMDFKWSDNNGVRVLASFIEYCERQEWSFRQNRPESFVSKKVSELLATAGVPFQYYPKSGNGLADSFVQHESNRILLIDPQPDIETGDVVGYYQNLQERFTHVKLVLSIDFWLYRKRIVEEVKDFFME